MEQYRKHLTEVEIEDLKHELENFKQEKERVRGIIGGMPKFNTKLINTVFFVFIIASIAISVTAGDKW